MPRVIGMICSLMLCVIACLTTAATKAKITKNLGDFGVVQKLLDSRAQREAANSDVPNVHGMTVDDLEEVMKKMCPMNTGFGTTLVDVTQHPKNQLNCIYEIPDHMDMSDPQAQRAAKETALKQFKKRDLAEPTKQLGVVWNYVYRRSYGAVVFSMKITPEDLDRAPLTKVTSKLNSSASAVSSRSGGTSSTLGAGKRTTSSRRRDDNHGRSATGSNSGVLANPFVQNE